MTHPIGWGLALVVLGGMLNGSFAAPMKKLAVWRWENIWLLYSMVGLLILPWTVALATVPHLAGVFQQSSPAVMVKGCPVWIRLGNWRSVIWPRHRARGHGAGFCADAWHHLLLWSTASYRDPASDDQWKRPGLALMAGTVVMTLGLVLLAIAGKRRERDQAAASTRSNFAVGLVICFLSGIFSAMLNFAFVFGDEMRQLTLHAGASSAMSGNAIWALGVSCGCSAQRCLLHLPAE